MNARSLLLLAAGTLTISGCAMFTAWKSIPPPGGCDQCHSLPISSDWKVSYQAAILTDERRSRAYFQTEQYNIPQTNQPSSPLDQRKVEELRCFECHKSPSPSHKERAGRYHH